MTRGWEGMAGCGLDSSDAEAEDKTASASSPLGAIPRQCLSQNSAPSVCGEGT